MRAADETLRIALVSDTHGFLDPRVAGLVEECDVAVHAGDIGSLSVLESLRPRSGRVVAVRGNNDVPQKWPAHERSALAHLPLDASLDLPGGVLYVVHGDRAGAPTRLHGRLRRLNGQARGIVYGHTHRLVCDCESLPWVLNPGAAGCRRTFGGPSCVVLEVDAAQWRVRAHRFAPAGRVR
jgi:uncharacterized protein